ncbi:VPLPA-CTERM sorting domain-containing protein [Rhodovulum viride]|uniref:VPLPA-CTERM sorting domain-containing protein n=1 Tax=Rhodovulum viride TaxID=1231134 RepID=UPI0011BDEB0F|nr:VPLPA-CTERM sorting domain-containing protein [Rhodovulum viride]
MRNKLLAGLTLSAVAFASSSAFSATISLVGTELKLDVILQATPTSPTSTFTATVSAIVSETAVEYPNVNDFGITNTSVPGFPRPITTVPVAIDAGADFITIDFDNTAPFNQFAPAFQNTYVFTFADTVAPLITSAEIDTTVTTLGLAPEDITFSGNKLFANVESLYFDTSSFVRINLTAEAGVAPVPLPAGLPLMLSGLLGMRLFAGRKRKAF